MSETLALLLVALVMLCRVPLLGAAPPRAHRGARGPVRPARALASEQRAPRAVPRRPARLVGRISSASRRIGLSSRRSSSPRCSSLRGSRTTSALPRTRRHDDSVRLHPRDRELPAAYYGSVSAPGRCCARSRCPSGDAVREGRRVARPRAALRVGASRVGCPSSSRPEGRAWSVFRPFQQTHLDSRIGSPLWVERLRLLSYWLLAPAAIAGAVVLRRRRVTLIPLLAVIIEVVVTAALAFGDTRYRAPAEVPIVLLAAVFLDASWRRAPFARPERDECLHWAPTTFDGTAGRPQNWTVRASARFHVARSRVEGRTDWARLIGQRAAAVPSPASPAIATPPDRADGSGGSPPSTAYVPWRCCSSCGSTSGSSRPRRSRNRAAAFSASTCSSSSAAS